MPAIHTLHRRRSSTRKSVPKTAVDSKLSTTRTKQSFCGWPVLCIAVPLFLGAIIVIDASKVALAHLRGVSAADTAASNRIKRIAMFLSAEMDKPDTLEAFSIPVEVREKPELGPGRKGLFATAEIAEGTRDWWHWKDHLVFDIHKDDLDAVVAALPVEKQKIFLREGFTLRAQPDLFFTAPRDAYRYLGHSNHPNTGWSLKHILPGEELTFAHFHVPEWDWYKRICKQYGVPTFPEFARTHTLDIEPTDDDLRCYFEKYMDRFFDMDIFSNTMLRKFWREEGKAIGDLPWCYE